jgi:hypothetical protein
MDYVVMLMRVIRAKDIDTAIKKARNGLGSLETFASEVHTVPGRRMASNARKWAGMSVLKFHRFLKTNGMAWDEFNTEEEEE